MALIRIENYRGLSARIIEIIIGAILLLAGLLKAYQPLDFIQQIGDYKIITAPFLIKVTAWTMIIIECGLGMALIAGFRRRIALPATVVLFVGFLTLVGWAWYTGATEDCGCFGSWVKRTPAEAFAEDLVMLLAITAAWILSKHEPIRYRTLRYSMVLLAAISGVAVTGMSSNSSRQSSDPMIRLKSQSAKPGILEGIKIDGISENLQNGYWTLVLMDTGCTHCQQSVPELNKLGSAGGTKASVVALCSNSEAEVAMFKNKYQAQFPIGRIKYDDFMKIFERGKTPRIILLHNGVPVRIWDGMVPTKEEMDPLIKD